MRRIAAMILVTLSVALGGLPASGDEPSSQQSADDAADVRILVFTKTAGFRHGSIPAGVEAIEQLGADHGFAVDATEDAGAFTEDNLERYAAVVFLSTDGDVLDDAQKGAFQDYIRSGGGYAGIHAASATEYGWEWYGELVGAYFDRHPAIQTAVVNVDDRAHPSTAHLPARWEWTDEWYDFDRNPRGDVHVLATVDERTYSGGEMGLDHPVAWCHDFDGGRSWYTSLGHSSEHFSDPSYLQHLLGGIQTAAGVVGADCGATIDENFEKVEIDTDTLKPIRVEVAPDGRVFYLEQYGEVRIYKPDTDEIVVAADFVAERDIYNQFENGTIGIAFDPDFETNNWIYLYYTPRAQATEPQRAPGHFGNAVRLSGGEDYISLPEGIVSELEDFTIATWVNPEQVQTWQRVFDFGRDTARNMFLTASAGSAPRFAITTGGNAAGEEQQLNGTAPLATNRWTHLAVTLSGTTGTLYVDGQPVDVNDSMTLSPSDLGVTTQNWIGRSQYPDPYLAGLVDEFQIYDRALSQADIQSMAVTAGGDAGGGNVAWYRFDEQAGAAVADSSPNGNDGTLFAAASIDCPPTERDGATCGEAWLSRFTMDGDVLDFDSEQVLLKVLQQRDTCCHTTGDMTFDSEGNLYLATGDDTNPWESSGYTPIDERSGRNAYDAQRTSGNTNDLRGKILRITPQPDGTYTIPEGNLFEPGTALTRPEIYAMGLRNPFTIAIDPATDALAVADYGPDAAIANPLRGPEGRVELNYMTEAGNYGWPYCVGENDPYTYHQFATGAVVTPGLPFDCDNLVNDSPNNTGLRELPPGVPSTLYQTWHPSSFPPNTMLNELQGYDTPDHALAHGQSPMTGPFFQYDEATEATEGGLPAYYHGAQFWMDWNRGWIHEIRRDDDNEIRTINRFLPSVSLRRPIEMSQHPDGSLYLAEWGLEQFFGPNTDSGLYRIRYDN